MNDRYELRHGRFGAYLHDSKLEHPKYGGAMDLNDILKALNQNEALTVSLKETAAEAIEHRKNIIEAKAADFQGIADPKYQSAYDQEIARFDALIDRANAALHAAGIQIEGER